MTNHGIDNSLPLIKETDWVVGAESGITYQDVCHDWNPFKPEAENQAYPYEDMSCVTHSENNEEKMLLNFLIQNDAELKATLAGKGMIDAAGKVMLNDQYVAIGSGTSTNGNSGPNVINFIRQNGHISPDMLNHRGSNIYQWLDKTLLTPSLLALGATFWKDIGYEPFYEWIDLGDRSSVPEILAFHVKQAPLQLYVNICPGYNTDNPAPTCPIAAPQHAILLMSEQGALGIFDSEVPNTKSLSLNYPIYACKKTVILKTPAPQNKPSYTWTKEMDRGATGPDVVALQNVLIYEGLLNKKLNTGYFGDNTFNALVKFQEAHAAQILMPAHLSHGTGHFGKFTMSYCNQIYK